MLAAATVAAPQSAEEANDDAALTVPAEDFRGIFGGCKVRWTRVSFEAARILARAESSKGEGNRPADEGKSA